MQRGLSHPLASHKVPTAWRAVSQGSTTGFTAGKRASQEPERVARQRPSTLRSSAVLKAPKYECLRTCLLCRHPHATRGRPSHLLPDSDHVDGIVETSMRGHRKVWPTMPSADSCSLNCFACLRPERRRA